MARYNRRKRKDWRADIGFSALRPLFNPAFHRHLSHAPKGKQLVENVIYKSHELPGSSVISLDDHSEYLTVTGNVFWCEGRAGTGQGHEQDIQLKDMQAMDNE